MDFSDLHIEIKKTAAEICAQLRAFSFREYQLPKINGKSVVRGEITQYPSREKPGRIIWEDDMRAIITTVDYNIVIYWDKFAEVMKAAADGDMDFLRKIPCLECYVNQGNEQGVTPLMAALNNRHYDIYMLFMANGGEFYDGNTFC